MKIVETHDERNVVAVFVEVDANCPDQVLLDFSIRRHTLFERCVCEAKIFLNQEISRLLLNFSLGFPLLVMPAFSTAQTASFISFLSAILECLLKMH